MRYYIKVFIVYPSTILGVSSIQSVNVGMFTKYLIQFKCVACILFCLKSILQDKHVSYRTDILIWVRSEINLSMFTLKLTYEGSSVSYLPHLVTINIATFGI